MIRTASFSSQKSLLLPAVFLIVLFTYFDAVLATPSSSLNSTNSTIAGASIKYSLYWSDSSGLSGYIFSFDNCTGSFVNDTGIALSGTENWSNVTKTVTGIVGCTIRWKIYTNNSNNEWNQSETYSYLTTGGLGTVRATLSATEKQITISGETQGITLMGIYKKLNNDTLLTHDGKIWYLNASITKLLRFSPKHVHSRSL